MKKFYVREIRPNETFVPGLLKDFLIALEATETSEEVWTLIVDCAASIGLPVVDYVCATDYRNWEQAQFIRTTFPPAWLELVRQNPHIRYTSNFRMHAVHYLTPIVFGCAYLPEMGDITDQKRRHMEFNRLMGLNAGIGFPLRMNNPGEAAFLGFGNMDDRATFDALIRDHGWTLHAMSLSGHTRYTELFKSEFIERNELTQKQKELITLVGQGMMDKQIAHELDISFSAVRQRLASVQQKTGAQNRAELAALAMRVGLVSDPLLKTHPSDLTVFLSMGDGSSGREMRRPGSSGPRGGLPSAAE